MSEDEKTGERPRKRFGGSRPQSGKATAEGLQSQFDERRAARRVARAEHTMEDRRRTRRRAVNALLGLGIVGCLAFSSIVGGRMSDQGEANAGQIASLTEKVADLKNQPIHEDPVGSMTSLADLATKDAARVADDQQAFQGLYAASADDPGTRDGAPSAAEQAIADHRAGIGGLFDKGSFIVPDDLVATPGSMVFEDPDHQIDPRYEWFVRYDGVNPSAPDASAWTVASITPVFSETDASGATDEVTVVWTCVDSENGKTLAWASATYTMDGDSGSFSDLSVTVSTFGAQHQRKTGE